MDPKRGLLLHSRDVIVESESLQGSLFLQPAGLMEWGRGATLAIPGGPEQNSKRGWADRDAISHLERKAYI